MGQSGKISEARGLRLSGLLARSGALSSFSIAPRAISPTAASAYAAAMALLLAVGAAAKPGSAEVAQAPETPGVTGSSGFSDSSDSSDSSNSSDSRRNTGGSDAAGALGGAKSKASVSSPLKGFPRQLLHIEQSTKPSGSRVLLVVGDAPLSFSSLRLDSPPRLLLEFPETTLSPVLSAASPALQSGGAQPVAAEPGDEAEAQTAARKKGGEAGTGREFFWQLREVAGPRLPTVQLLLWLGEGEEVEASADGARLWLSSRLEPGRALVVLAQPSLPEMPSELVEEKAQVMKLAEQVEREEGAAPKGVDFGDSEDSSDSSDSSDSGKVSAKDASKAAPSKPPLSLSPAASASELQTATSTASSARSPADQSTDSPTDSPTSPATAPMPPEQTAPKASSKLPQDPGAIPAQVLQDSPSIPQPKVELHHPQKAQERKRETARVDEGVAHVPSSLPSQVLAPPTPEKAEKVESREDEPKEESEAAPKLSEHRARVPLVAVHRLLFRKERQGARFIVLTEGPVHFSVEERSPGALVLTLENAHIPLATNRLPLETRFFGASVTRIRPENQAKSAQVRIHIALEGEVAYRVRQHSQGLEVDFMPPEGRLAADFQLAGARP